jgi:hypothetical protein
MKYNSQTDPFHQKTKLEKDIIWAGNTFSADDIFSTHFVKN